MKEMTYAEMQNINGGFIGWVILGCGIAIYVGGWVLPKWVKKLIEKNGGKYKIK